MNDSQFRIFGKFHYLILTEETHSCPEQLFFIHGHHALCVSFPPGYG